MRAGLADRGGSVTVAVLAGGYPGRTTRSGGSSTKGDGAMIVAKTIDEVRGAIRQARADGKSIGLVPTMGALHEGHLSLIAAARDRCEFVAVSIFVNPAQFGPGEDLAAYPRPLEADLSACEAAGVDLVFAPDAETMYPGEALAEVSIGRLGQVLCGRSRPTHFAGVCTVVAKLFNIVAPDKAFFGAKDFQQAVIVRRMARELNFAVEIVVCPTIREPDGLAMSSRNAYLTADERRQAAALHESLRMAAEMIADRHPPAGHVLGAMRELLCVRAPAGAIDYLEIVDPNELRSVESTDGPVLIALAVRFDKAHHRRFGKARLIDNILVDGSAAGP